MALTTLIGRIFCGRYEVIDVLGMGGQAIVVKVIDRQTDAFLAIKCLIASPGDPNYQELLSRFQRESRICIGHPNVLDPLAYFEEDGQAFTVFPFLEGVPLSTYLATKGGRLTVAETEAVIVALADAVAACHAKGIIHRDIKPENILIRPDGTPCLLDLGICRSVHEQTITSRDMVLGTLGFMAPEQLRSPGSVDTRADLYALGALTYVMLTGRPAVNGTSTQEILANIEHETPVPPRQLDPSIPERVDQACMRLLAKDPNARFQSAAEFAQAIEGIPPAAAAAACPKCNAPTRPNARFCGACGARLAQSQPESLRCLACGTPVGEADLRPGCGRTFSPDDHRLQFTSGTLTGMVFRIPQGIYVVGREQFASRDQQISRSHFYAACFNGSVLIQDAGSVNRTFVGGQFAGSPLPLVANQEFRVAACAAIYTLSSRRPAW